MIYFDKDYRFIQHFFCLILLNILLPFSNRNLHEGFPLKPIWSYPEWLLTEICQPKFLQVC